MSAKLFSEEVQHSFSVSRFRDEAFEHLTLMIDSAPEVMLYAVDLRENFVEMPLAMSKCAHRDGPASLYLSSKYLTETVPSVAHRLMRDIDAPLVEEILDVLQRERIANIQHHGQADDFRGGFELSEEGRDVIAPRY